MIQTILILILIHYINLYLFKPKHNTLNCGNFGWAGKDVKKFNKDKFDKLGMLNVERGKSSCGISFDGDIQIGIDQNKLYYDFIVNREIKPKRFPIVIGHTRQSSVGSVNIYNAHPFGFGDNNGDFIFIGSHNGTLKNHKELAKKYEIEESVDTGYYDKHNKEIIVKRDKIDSEILLEIIYTHKNFKVLSEYTGGAALVFTDTTKPNVLYLFKGKSRDYGSSTFETEERPLYVYVENKNSMYFSSLEDSLKTIGGNDNNIIDLECNTVYKITDGDFKNAELIGITRINATQNISYTHRNHNHYGPNYGLTDDMFDCEYNENIYGTAFKEIGKKEKTEEIPSRTLIPLPTLINQRRLEKEEEKNKSLNIYNESLLKKHDEYKGKPYFNKLRWYRNGQLISGVYVWINNYGYYPVGSTVKTANEKFYTIIDKVFDGKDFYDDDAFNKGKIPFDSSKIVEPCFFYFVQGVQVKTALDYATFYNKFSSLKAGFHLDYIDLSHVSTHPVINLNFELRDQNQQGIVKNGQLFDGVTTLLGAEKIYHIEKGNLKVTTKNVIYSDFEEDFYKIEKDEEEIKLSEEIVSFSEQEEILEQSDDLLIDEMIAKEEEENKIIRDLCEEDFTEPIKDFQQIRAKMFNNFVENPLAIKVINFVDNTLKDMEEFINE